MIEPPIPPKDRLVGKVIPLWLFWLIAAPMFVMACASALFLAVDLSLN
jgi:hypothetical protein